MQAGTGRFGPRRKNSHFSGVHRLAEMDRWNRCIAAVQDWLCKASASPRFFTTGALAPCRHLCGLRRNQPNPQPDQFSGDGGEPPSCCSAQRAPRTLDEFLQMRASVTRGTQSTLQSCGEVVAGTRGSYSEFLGTVQTDLHDGSYCLFSRN